MQHLAKTTDTLQQSKFTRVTKAQEGESEGKREEWGKGERRGEKECNKEGGSEARCFKMPQSIVLLLFIFL